MVSLLSHRTCQELQQPPCQPGPSGHCLSHWQRHAEARWVPICRETGVAANKSHHGPGLEHPHHCICSLSEGASEERVEPGVHADQPSKLLIDPYGGCVSRERLEAAMAGRTANFLKVQSWSRGMAPARMDRWSTASWSGQPSLA